MKVHIVRDNRILSLSTRGVSRAKLRGTNESSGDIYVRREKDERRYRRAFVVSVTVQALIKVSQSIARPERDESNQQSPTQSVIVEAKLRLADGYGSKHRNRTLLQSRNRPKHIDPFCVPTQANFSLFKRGFFHVFVFSKSPARSGLPSLRI